MSGYKTHLTAYVIAAAAVYYFLFRAGLKAEVGVKDLIGGGVGVVYTLAPDIDSRTSRIRRFFNLGSASAVAASTTAYLISGDVRYACAALALSALTAGMWLTRHRGAFHQPIAGALMSAPLALIDPLYAGMGFLGYGVHLALDGRLLGRARV
ncbi:MAG: hypothetical protein GF416_02880 [Candidatus Altiarchaeales archaeon]|nr:hypothetical protein [Candidatus Altiarchaeales archaeon]MBD3416064.1 hypothetical protein [Candidatus Altiarchaeales archaeon]